MTEATGNIINGKNFIFWIFLLLLTYFFIELTSFGIYFGLRHKAFSFTDNQKELSLIIAKTTNALTQEFGSLKGTTYEGKTFTEVIHPYLGYVRNPLTSNGYSELGFIGDDIGIYQKDSNRVVVGVFGGSFAEGTVLYGKNTFIKILKTSPRFANKDIKVMNFTLGGYKQPQQMLCLAYLLSLGYHFDIVVNIDGFNEVALPTAENIPKRVSPFFPRNWIARVGGFDSNMLELRNNYVALVKDRRNWAEWFSKSVLRYSVTANVFWRAYDNVLFKEITETTIAAQNYRVSDITKQDYMITGPSFRPVDEASTYDELVGMWKRASIQMHAMSTGNGIKYYHFLQPNQYVQGSKPLHAMELKDALSGSPYRKGAELGYPKLIAFGKELIREGVDFHDLTMIFSDHKEPLYVDDCCHVGQEGYSIVASVLAQEIIRRTGP